jgi:ABC-type multidrug transport system fused ATPase/permease subunit
VKKLQIETDQSRKYVKVDEEESKDPVLVEMKQVSMRGMHPHFTWTNLSVVLPKSGQVLIDNVSGYVSAGKVCALMGPSGA